MTDGVAPLLDGVGLAAGVLAGLDGVVLESAPLSDPSTEVLLSSLTIGLLFGAGLGYHAYTTGRNAIIWGLVGFFFSILGAVVYVLYVVLSSSSSEEPDQLEPRTEFGDHATETDAESVPDAGTDTQQSAAGDNQWRHVAHEADPDAASGGGVESDTSAATTAPRGAATDREPPTMVVELIHDEGRRYTRSDVTEIERDGEMIALIDPDGNRSTYGNAQIEQVWLSTAE